MNTHAQNAAIHMIYDGANALPQEMLAQVIYTITADSLNADQLEQLGNRLGRASHEKGRTDD